MSNEQAYCNVENSSSFLISLCTGVCSVDSNVECVQDLDSENKRIRFIVGLLSLIITIIGVFGNSLTLLSVPFAIRREKFGFDRNIETTIFILNLSCIDILYCLLCGLHLSTSFLCNTWMYSLQTCRAIYFVGNILAYNAATAMALVAMSRCLELTRNKIWMKLSRSKVNLCLMSVGTWIAGILGFSIQIEFDYHLSVGWNCELGVCGHVPWKLQSKFYFVSICVIISSIAISYIIMWKKVQSSAKILVRSGNTNMDIEDRQRKLTRMILILVCSFTLCNIPMHLTFIFTFSRDFFYLSVVLYSSQYGINFIIYHLSNPEYRNASTYYLRYIASKFSKTLPDNIIQQTNNGTDIALRSRASAKTSSTITSSLSQT